MKTETSQYAIVYPHKLSARHLTKSLFHPENLDFQAFAEWPQEVGAQAFSDNWRVTVSLLLMRMLDLHYYPLWILGFVTEFTLNFINLNGGLFSAFFKLVTGRLQIPRPGSEKYLSIIGLLEHRTDLLEKKVTTSDKVEHPPGNPGDRFYIDLCAMAASTAYENAEVVKSRVNNHWKMNLVNFYNLWNHRRKTKDTQAYIFTDRAEDANLIVLVFRGTEPFNAHDWATDADMSWFKIPYVGKVHLGFMEGLGIANRSEADVLKNLFYHQSEVQKPLAYYTLVSELHRLMQTHKNAKILVTGHSLGGALAILFVAVLILKNEDEVLNRMKGVYTYGQPRVGDEEFGKYVESRLNHPVPRYYRLVYCNDIVPRVPFDDNVFLFKHFGLCLCYSSFFDLQNLPDEPNKNFSVLYFIAYRLNALWEAMICLLLPYFKGHEFKETWLCTITRFTAGLLFPGVVSHCLVNYVTCARLGPPQITLN